MTKTINSENTEITAGISHVEVKRRKDDKKFDVVFTDSDNLNNNLSRSADKVVLFTHTKYDEVEGFFQHGPFEGTLYMLGYPMLLHWDKLSVEETVLFIAKLFYQQVEKYRKIIDNGEEILFLDY